MNHSLPHLHQLSRTLIACLIISLMILSPLAPLAQGAPKWSKRVETASGMEPTAPFAPAITATKTDSFPDLDGDGKAAPGETITYDVNISNTGPDDATGVNFLDMIDANTTLVGGSLKVSPLAFPDVFGASQNTPLVVSAPGVLTNDTGLPAPTAVPIAGGATTQGGTVTLNADGSFTYNPPTGFEGNDSFTYTATNGLTPNDTTLVTLNVDARPSVTNTTPANGATEVAQNTDITITFSEAVDVTGDWFQISCTETGTRNVADTAVSGGPTTFTINPNTDFAPTEICTVTVIAAQVTDQDVIDPPDQMAANFIFSFTTTEQELAPTVTNTTPGSGAVDQPTNTDITVTFSESVNVTGNWFQIVCTTSGTRNPADTVVTPASPASTFTINPNADFAPGEACTATIFAAQVTDADANDPPDNMAANFVFAFTMDVAPSVTATTPTNGATQVANNTNISITFNEPVDVTGNWFQIVGATSGTKNVADTVVTGGPTTFDINPADFANGELVTVTVFAAQVSDQDTGDPPNNMAANFVFSFTIDAAPSVTSTTPTNGATGQALNSNVSITFSEAVNVTGNWFQIVCANSGTRNVADTVVTGGPTTFTINPNTDFTANELCTVTVFAAQVTDQDSGDPPDNMTANFVFSFTTLDVAPTVTATTPTNGAVNQTTNTDISVTFSEPVNVTGNWFQIVCTTSGTRNVVDTVVTGGPTTFNVNPNVDFASGESCTVTVFAAQVTDQDSNDPPDNMAANFVFTFSMDAAPTVNATTPTNGATQVANNTNVTITFSEPVDVTGNWFQLVGATSGTRNVADTVVSGGPTTFTINPNVDFANGELVTVTVFAAQVSDQDSNDPPQNMAANFVFSFTIDQAPSVTATTPTNGATAVAAATNITITFSEAVNVTGDWFQIVCGTQTKNPADTVVTGGPTTFTINPTTDLLAGNICQVTVFAAQVTDQDSGDPPDNMVANFVFSFSVPPVAVNDTYAPTIVGNVGINTDNSTEFSVLTNDTPTTGVTINTSGTSAQGGTVVVAADGKFSYIPAAGFEGADSFTYTIMNASGTSNSATVSLTVAGMIWFINSAAGAGNGRLATPFNSVASFQAINVGGGNNPAAGDNIFIFENASAYTGPITLLSNQKLIGQDATATLAAIAGVSVPADSFLLPAMNTGAPATTLNSSSAGVNAVNLNGAGTGNTVRGLTLTTGSATSKGINGTTFGTLTTADLIISGSGPALDLTTGSLSGSFNSISSSGGANGIRLSAIGGSSTLGTGSLSGSTAEEFFITGTNSTVTLTYDGTISTTSAASRPVSISGKTTSGNVTFNGAVSASGSSGVNLDNNDGATISFLGGLSLSTGTNTAFNAINGGTVVATQNNTTIVNTLTTTTGTALNVANTNIGASGLTFRSISANGGANGIVLNTTGASGGLTVTGNSSGFCGGQVTGIPLSITTAPNTADCTGGRIQATTGADGASSGIGISLTSTQNVSLTRMRLDNHSNFAIKGSSVTALTLSNVLIDGVNGSTTSPDEGSINIVNLLGTSSMTNSTVRGGFEDNINILNNTGTGTFTITGSTIRDNSTTTGNDGVFGQADPGATFTLKVINSVLQRNRGDHVNTTQSGNGVINTIVTGNTMTFNGTIGQPFDLATTAGGSVTLTTGANFTGTSSFNVSNNNITGAKTGPININNTALTSTLTGIFTGTINGNTIGLTGAVGSGSDGDGIDVTANGNANITATITNNNIRQWKLLGINLVPRDGAATMNVTVQGNQVGEPSNTTESLQAILLNAGPATTETGNTCANIGGAVAGQPNTFPGTFSAGILPIRVRQRAVNTVFLPGYGGAATDTAAVVAYLSGRNGGAGATATVNSPPGGGFQNTPGGAPCTAGAAPTSPEQATDLATNVESPQVLDTRQPAPIQLEAKLPTEGARGINRTKRDLGMVLRYSPKDTWAPLAKRQELNAMQDKTPRRGIVVRPRVQVLSGETVSHSVGTLLAGKTVHIQFQVTVNNPYLGGEFVSNQGTVSGSNFADVLTDDPAVGGSNDPTQTPILQIPTISVADAQVAEPSSGSTNMVFTVTLNAPAPAGGASVDFTTQDQAPPAPNHATAGQDYTTTTGTVNFAQGEQIKVISVPVLSDNNNTEQNETFLVVLSNPVNGTIANGTSTGTILIKNQPGTILITELRTSGPAGDGDDFVEIYNNSETPHTVNDPSGGYGLFKMGADCSANPILIGVIPNGTVIPTRGHYLFTGSAYSLANYGGTNAAAGDQVLSQDIESDRNVALFSTTSLVNLSTATRLDAVGFGTNTGQVCDLLREGTTLVPLSGSTLEYSYFRDECGKKGNPATFGICPTTGFVQDSNVNIDDFTFVDTAATATPAGQRLGAPGPQNLGSPRMTLSVAALLLDATVGAPASPNRLRSTAAFGDFPSGTLTVNRRFQNNTGAPVTRLRFRIVDISSFTSSLGIADVRAISSTTIVLSGINDSATCAATGSPATAPCSVTVLGTTLEEPPVQAKSGGLNSSLSAGTITLPSPLAPGASLNFQLKMGVMQTGSFKFFFNIEALP